MNTKSKQSTGEKPELVIPKLIVGLGNPEPKYNRTRHNIGFEAVDELARLWHMPLSENRRFQGLFSQGLTSRGDKICLLKPLTYMNRSGQSVRGVTDWYKFSPESVLVIYDDMDLPLGRIRIRMAGSPGGHNGMKSIISHLGGQKFPRLRIGIGKSEGKKETISHVLGKFSPEEQKYLPEIFDLVVGAVELSLKQGLAKAMSLYNGRTINSLQKSSNE